MASMVDGVQFGERRCVVALGVDIDGVKHPAFLVPSCWSDARRGLDVSRPIVTVLDGSKRCAARHATRSIIP
jgi:putative transposase